MLAGIESVLRTAELDVLLYPVGDVQDRRVFFKRLPARRKVDAVVIIAFPLEPSEQRRLELMGVHIVAAGGQSVDYPYVCIDDEIAGRQAVDHLVYLGHRRIGMLEAVDPDQPGLVSRRSAAYYASLNDAGIPIDPARSSNPTTGAANTAPNPWRSCSACANPPPPSTPIPTRSPSAPSEPCDGPDCAYRRTSRSSASTTTRSPNSPI